MEIRNRIFGFSTFATLTNKRSVNWLSTEYEKNKGQKTIIVTHHSPSAGSLLGMHKDDRINAAYASNLEYLVETLAPDFWIHGHPHQSFDYRIGQTRVVCNPRGYPDNRNENLLLHCKKGKGSMSNRVGKMS